MVLLRWNRWLFRARARNHASVMIARYIAGVSNLAAFKLFLTGYAVVGIAYVCIGSGAFSGEQDNWWGSLPQLKKGIFISAMGATLLQTFL
jgi:hypothetical protein